LPDPAGVAWEPAKLLAALAKRLPEQAQQRQQQEQTQQRLPKGQLPPDQQAELDNGLNSLGQSLLRVWLLGCTVCEAVLADFDAHGDGDFNRVGAHGMVHLNRHYSHVPHYAELAVTCWPASEDAAGSSVAAPSSGSSSSSETVRYVKQVLPRLGQVTAASALPAALATAQVLATCIDAMQELTSSHDQQLKHEAEDFGMQSLQSSMLLDGQAVLGLQLLLLTCRAKLLFQEMEVTQHGRSQVRVAAPKILQQQQQQQQQQDIDGLHGQLRLNAYHEPLLRNYNCKDADMATLKQQYPAAVPHVG
jgi:hypothetical protein